MSKVTKWAVERAKTAMKEAIDRKMCRFEDLHQPKREEPTTSELMLLAVKDPKWQAYAVRKANAGDNNIYIRDEDIVSHSPAARELLDNWKASEKPRRKMIDDHKANLNSAMESIITRAVIGDMDSADLLKEVEQFCK